MQIIKPNINLPQFQIDKLKPNTKTLILGCEKSGKSSLIKDILYQNKKIRLGRVITTPSNIENTYNGLVPAYFTYTYYKAYKNYEVICNQKLNDFIEIQTLDDKWPIFMIFDDNDQSYTMSVIDKFFKQTDNLEILTVFSTDKYIKTNIFDYVFIFFDEKILDSILNIFDIYNIGKKYDIESFIMLCKSLDDYKCLVIDKDGELFYYHADIHEKFRVAF